MSDYEDAQMDVMDAKHRRAVREAQCDGQGGGCLKPLCRRCRPSDDTVRARKQDEVSEARQAMRVAEAAFEDACVALDAYEVAMGLPSILSHGEASV